MMGLPYAAFSTTLWQNLWKTDAELQFAALRISSVVTPALAAADADALREECAPEMEASIPACSIVFLTI